MTAVLRVRKLVQCNKEHVRARNMLIRINDPRCYETLSVQIRVNVTMTILIVK